MDQQCVCAFSSCNINCVIDVYGCIVGQCQFPQPIYTSSAADNRRLFSSLICKQIPNYQAVPSAIPKRHQEPYSMAVNTIDEKCEKRLIKGSKTCSM